MNTRPLFDEFYMELLYSIFKFMTSLESSFKVFEVDKMLCLLCY